MANIGSEASPGHCGQRMVQVLNKSENKVILVGNVGKETEVKYTASGVPVGRFSLGEVMA